MNKVLRLVGNSYIRSLKLGCLSSTSKNISEMKKNKTSAQDNFIQYAYGMESQFHFLPKRLKRKMEIPEENYKFYKKYSPNYLVILVRKVLQENSFFKQFNKADVNNNLTKEANKVDGKEPEIVENHLDKFYHTCAFCQVQYLPNNQIQLQGLFNVRIRDIKQVEASEAANVENLSNPHPIITSVSQKQEKQENDEITEPNIFTQNMDEREIRGEGKKKIPSIYSITKRSLRRNSKSEQKSQRYWWVKAEKIIQPPLILTSQIELKFKYLIQRYIQMNNYTLGRFEPLFNTVDIVQMLDSIAGQCIRFNVDKSSLQRYIEATEYETKIDQLIEITNNILHLNQHFSIIENEAKNVIRNKKLYQYYSEVMKVSKHILEGNKAKHIFIEKCKKRFYQMNPPKEVEKVFELEVERFRQLDSNQMESATVKAYIQELSKIPYNVQSQQIFDVEYAQKVLNQQHYGMKDVKDAILQIIASGQLKKQLKGKIFCFIGGPGIGKTSFAKSVAKALNRKFYNISLGGASDSSVLKGHRRTYVGAYSGKIIEALRNCGTNNPVILLDQIDKMGNSYHGDPRAQLLQILDPNQNNAFVDLYLDVPVDLSNVLFITTANYERNISRPLLNRMQKIYLTNYSKEEKIEIFNRHLLKRAIQSTGVKADQFELPQQVVEALVEQYSLRQPGVRFLQKSALKILQKIAYKIVSKQQQAPVKISKQSLRNYLGNSYFRRKDHNNLGKGLAISLGGGGYDSRLTYIEAFRTSFVSRKQINRGTLFTGSLSQVFKEAMNISYTYARNFLLQKYNNRFLFQNQVHVHAPEGGFKKDGSTDSLTIVSALVSLSLDTKVKEGVAMTGQITLNGHLLRTEGIKQKIMVANRERIREVVLPKDNEPDVQNLSKDIKQGIKFHYVSNFSEAFAYLFPEKVQKNVEIQG